jgi:hypothetical protein
VADLMVFNLAVAWGWLHRAERKPIIVYAAAALFVVGALASGQISAAIALVLCAGTIVFLAGSLRPVASALPLVLAAGIALRPVIDRRLHGFSSPDGLPESWVGRLRNLRTYFFPELFSDFHFVLGVRPTARILLSQRRGYVWIESGYTWLLWAGGIPFLLSFLYFTWTNLRTTLSIARARADAVGIAATGSFVALVIVGVLMLFDPHLSYRGSGDMFFALLALSTVKLRDSFRPGDGATVAQPSTVRRVVPIRG